MRRINKKELIKQATAQNRLTKEFKTEIEEQFALYQLRIIEETELFESLHLLLNGNHQ